uniref:Transmembrane protein 220-like n=1 Tax=Saccoglossus kowalevskii TaxID=10224 RepID=A0ABM0M1P8_SACKO|nr:PREDICTED: transmembrane protein 220-like [Saccoglossus kowalevskii]
MLGIVAIVSASITDNPVYKWLVVIHIGACIVGMAYSVASIGQFTDNPMKKEEGREFTGLLIVTVWLTFCRFNWINNGSNTKPIQMSVILTIAVVMCVIPMAAWSVCLIVQSPSSPYHCADHRDVMQD